MLIDKIIKAGVYNRLYDGNMSISNVPLTIYCEHAIYPLCVIVGEDEDTINIMNTDKNGTEKLEIVFKDRICSIKFVYQDEVMGIIENENSKQEFEVA